MTITKEQYELIYLSLLAQDDSSDEMRAVLSKFEVFNEEYEQVSTYTITPNK